MTKEITDVPVWKYAKLTGETRQNIYRWIREGKIPADKVVQKEMVVKRIYIKI